MQRMAKKEASRAIAADAWPYGLGNLSDFKISIADLLNEVKGVFDDVISADVAEHLGIERTRSEFSDALKFSTRGKPDPDTDTEELLRIHNE